MFLFGWYQSTNQSIKQPTNQSMDMFCGGGYQSINQTANQPINPVNQFINQSLNQPAKWFLLKIGYPNTPDFKWGCSKSCFGPSKASPTTFLGKYYDFLTWNVNSLK